MGSLFSEPKAAVQTAVTPVAAPAATLVTEPQKKKERPGARRGGARAASILTTEIEDGKLGG